MAETHIARHARNDSGISIHSVLARDEPPSPTLTNPDMILPTQPWDNNRASPRGSNQLLMTSLSNASSQRSSGVSAELGIATAVLLPTRFPAHSITTNSGAESPTGPSYYGYEHGAPLSDIYEESEAPTPKSKATRRSRSPSPTHALDDSPAHDKRKNMLRHKKGLSSLSSSSGGSDVGDWENFDASKVLSGRAAADLAQMKREETLDVEDETSRRQSREEEELAALNARAEKILEHARKRLTHMGDNLKFARNSVITPTRSPSMKEPAGELYRSISTAGASKLAKSKPLYPPLKASSSLQHIRGGSDTSILSSGHSLQRLPEIRSASAMEYGSPSRYTLLPDTNPSPAAKFQPSPASNRSFNSPLVTLEEENDSPSTTKTSPESVKSSDKPAAPRGLGIHHVATKSIENLADTLDRPSSRQTPTPGHLHRSSSSASVRSAKELKEQMTDLKSRIADLKTRAQADTARRRSYQSLRSPSPSAQPEGYYTTSPAYQADNSSPVNANAGVGYRMASVDTSAAIPQPQFDGVNDNLAGPITPAHARFLDVDNHTPGSESRLLSSARTDRNTPTLARNRAPTLESVGQADRDDGDSSLERDAEDEGAPGPGVLTDADDSAEDEKIAENEEEQIYLNEVLEESLRDAEVGPEVPAIPGSFLDSPDGLPAVAGLESERHEDRIDAFDYENMFLHSAMGNYTGKSINGSDSGSDSNDSEDDDDNESVETRRAGIATPTNDTYGGDDLDQAETMSAGPASDDEFDGKSAKTRGSGITIRQGTTQAQHIVQITPPRNLAQNKLPRPSKPWTRKSGRNNSLESVSTTASFETATEGESNDDEGPSEIYNFGGKQSPAAALRGNQYRIQGQPTEHTRNASQSSTGSFQKTQGRDTPSSVSTVMQQGKSPGASPRQQYKIVHSPNIPAPQSPGLGVGVVGAENAQYINDNGVPERFQGHPSPKGQNPSQRLQAIQQSGPVPKAAHRHTRQLSANGIPLPTSPLTPTSGNRTSPRPSESPQRKVVLNRSLRHPPPMQQPPDMPLPQPPSGPLRNETERRTLSPPNQLQPAFQAVQSVQPDGLREHVPMPNTEILMESLIKLADPNFSLPSGKRFAEVDKDLVLGLLRAVGGVCNGVLRAGTSATGHPVVDELRGRLDSARIVLETETPRRANSVTYQRDGRGRNF